MKICKKCGLEKCYSDYYKESKSKDGLRSSCKSCMSEYQSKLDKSYKSEINKKSYLKNKKKSKEYYNLNKESIKVNRLKRYYTNKESEKEYAKNYSSQKRNELNEYRRLYNKKRTLVDPLYKTIISIRSLIFNSIRNNGFTKKSKTSEILGCSFYEFRIHIESQFEDWMNWSNHGKYTGNYSETWQIDHIKPISSAKSESEIFDLNHYTNLRPICSKLNNEKSNKLET